MPSDDHMPRQNEVNTHQPQATQGDAFVRHLEHASSVVQTWPAWQQEILGGTSTSTPARANNSSFQGPVIE